MKTGEFFFYPGQVGGCQGNLLAHRTGLLHQFAGARCYTPHFPFGVLDLPVDRCLIPRCPCRRILERSLAAVQAFLGSGQVDPRTLDALKRALLPVRVRGSDRPFPVILLALPLIGGFFAQVGLAVPLIGAGLVPVRGHLLCWLAVTAHEPRMFRWAGFREITHHRPLPRFSRKRVHGSGGRLSNLANSAIYLAGFDRS